MTSNEEKLQEHILYLKSLSKAQVEDLIAKDQCPYRPELDLEDEAIGMYHCPLCGDMVISMIPHPRRRHA